MPDEPIFVIRLPSANLKLSIEYFTHQGFSIVATEEVINTVWIKKDSLIFSLCECAGGPPMLVSYWQKPEVFLAILEELSIVCNFTADHVGQHFEAVFTDPGGMNLIVADHSDLPNQCRQVSYDSLFELSIPTVATFIDSVNFWNKIGFAPLPDRPRPHPWSRLKKNGFTIGLHQSTDWPRPGLVFENTSPFVNQTEIKIDLKNSGAAFISETIDSTLIYRIVNSQPPTCL